MESLGTDEKRVAIEVISTLCHVKRHMVELLLKPAGMTESIYQPLLYKRDEAGRVMSKREIAPLLLAACQLRSDAHDVVRRIVEIAASWTSFHLANDEYAARAVVHKARELLDMVQTMEAREAQAREIARQQELARMSREKGELLKKHSDLLLMMFDEMGRSSDPHGRGYLLQELMNRLFDLHEIPVYRSFTRNSGGEQIDGAFTEGHTETAISGDTRADWSEAFELVPSLQIAYASPSRTRTIRQPQQSTLATSS